MKIVCTLTKHNNHVYTSSIHVQQGMLDYLKYSPITLAITAIEKIVDRAYNSKADSSLTERDSVWK